METYRKCIKCNKLTLRRISKTEWKCSCGNTVKDKDIDRTSILGYRAEKL